MSPAPYLTGAERRRMADEIAPANHHPGHHGRMMDAALSRHERHDAAHSGPQLAAVRAALPPAWRLAWGMTGGGCSAWIVGRDTDRTGTEPYLMLTGAADETEASGDLSRGAIVGAYWPDDEPEDYREITDPDPLALARAVAELLALIDHPQEDDREERTA